MVNHEVAQFAGKAVAAVHNLAIANDARANARAKGNHDEVLHTAGHAIGHFAHSSCIGVVRHAAGNAEGFFKLLGAGNDAAPNEVGCILDVARIVVAVGRTDTDGAHVFDATDAVECGLECFHRGLYVVVKIWISAGGYNGLGLDGATLVNDTEHGVRTAHV